MRFVSLGIDAAWTDKEPSGLALLEQINDEVKLLRCGRSYNEFISGVIDWSVVPKGSEPILPEVLKSIPSTIGIPDCIAVDMPISNKRISSRRSCDNEISSAYGARGAAVHSPTYERPGEIAVRLYEELNREGYEWKLYNSEIASLNLIEVYPHSAIIEYFELDYRYEYKVSKKNSYKSFKLLSPENRLIKLITNLNWLINKLSIRVSNIADYIKPLDINQKYSTRELKGLEDLIDSIICSLVGLDYMNNNAIAYGKDDGAIWVPKNAKTFSQQDD